VGKQDVLVAFRGTADLHNWWTDLKCDFIHVREGRVHRGFYEAVQAVEQDLVSRVGSPQETRLWVTGHSLGGPRP
jgi:predicted lipase